MIRVDMQDSTATTTHDVVICNSGDKHLILDVTCMDLSPAEPNRSNTCETCLLAKRLCPRVHAFCGALVLASRQLKAGSQRSVNQVGDEEKEGQEHSAEHSCAQRWRKLAHCDKRTTELPSHKPAEKMASVITRRTN
eukprot:5519443-Amphidinium_carterae.1